MNEKQRAYHLAHLLNNVAPAGLYDSKLGDLNEPGTNTIAILYNELIDIAEDCSYYTLVGIQNEYPAFNY